jgi:hypothetical protein
VNISSKLYTFPGKMNLSEHGSYGGRGNNLDKKRVKVHGKGIILSFHFNHLDMRQNISEN